MDWFQRKRLLSNNQIWANSDKIIQSWKIFFNSICYWKKQEKIFEKNFFQKILGGKIKIWTILNPDQKIPQFRKTKNEFSKGQKNKQRLIWFNKLTINQYDFISLFFDRNWSTINILINSKQKQVWFKTVFPTTSLLELTLEI